MTNPPRTDVEQLTIVMMMLKSSHKTLSTNKAIRSSVENIGNLFFSINCKSQMHGMVLHLESWENVQVVNEWEKIALGMEEVNFAILLENMDS